MSCRSSGKREFLAGAVFAGVLAGCSNTEGGQVGSESGSCALVDCSEYGLGETSPAGFSANDILAYSQGDFSAVMTWTDGPQSPVTISIARTSDSATYCDYELPVGSKNELGCEDWLRILVSVEISTEDGRLAEVWVGEVSGSMADQSEVSLEFAEPDGTLDVDSFVTDPSRYDSIRWYLDIEIDSTGVQGSVYGLGQGRDDAGSFEEPILIGQFGS
jgi:hypothetical protein